MFTLTLNLRRMGDTRRVIAETQQPGLAVGSRAEAPCGFDDATLASLATLPDHAQGESAYGTRLGEAVFVGDVERLFERQRAAALAAGERLHVLLSVEDESLHGLHWERLAARDHAGRWRSLRMQQQTPPSIGARERGMWQGEMGREDSNRAPGLVPRVAETREPVTREPVTRELAVLLPGMEQGVREASAPVTASTLQDERVRQAQEGQRIAEKKRRILQWLAVAMSVVAGLAGLFSWRAKTAADEAVDAKLRAESAERTAIEERTKAVMERKLAEEQLSRAEAAQRTGIEERTESSKERKRVEEQPRHAEPRVHAKQLANALRAQHRAERLVYANTLSNAQRALQDGELRLARQYIDSAQWNLRGWEHDYLYTLMSQPKTTFRGHNWGVISVAFSPDGTQIVSGSVDYTLKVWDAQTGKAALTLAGHSDDVTSVAFSPDGTRIVSGSRDKTLKLWDAQTGQATLTLSGHRLMVNAVAFSPDGTRIVSGSQDNTVKVWDVSAKQKGASGKQQ